MTPLIEVRQAVKTFGLRSGRRRTTALDRVDVTLAKGETLGVVGESGSGKSTLGRALLRLIDLDGGTIRYEGREIQALTPAEFRPLRAKLQMVFQNPATSFNPMLTIEQALVDAMQLLTGLGATEKRLRTRRLLQDVELGDRFLQLYPYEMSGGQLQRAALARALAPEPAVIFLDEPTAALDMSVRGQVLNMLRSLQRHRDTAFMLVSHDLRVIRGTADRVVVMYLGRVVEEAPKRAIFDRPLHPYTRALLSAVHAGGGERLKGEAATAGPPEGCALVGRCPFATAGCEQPQPLAEVLPGRRVRCWRALDLPALEPEPA
jgi:oligopeptide/dipeptide ABC transporter ATP-binding protein